MFALLVAAFVFQTWLVYSDSTGRQTSPLSALADRGQQLWLRHNCQSCHQIYGFGGFLGPDLTNAVSSLTDARLRTILTEGAGRMPAFGFDDEERGALKQFLAELNLTGVSQARHQPAVPPGELLDLLVEKAMARGAVLTAKQMSGLVVMRREKCVACHLPNFSSPLRAPDLATAVERLGRKKILSVLVEGVPGTVMPRFEMPDAERESVVTFLEWMRTHHEEVARAFEGTQQDKEQGSVSIPWFEFE